MILEIGPREFHVAAQVRFCTRIRRVTSLASGSMPSRPLPSPRADLNTTEIGVTKVIAPLGGLPQPLKPTSRAGNPLSEDGLLFSHPSAYAIRALTYLAMQPPGKLTGTKEISEHEGIPASFLGKVLIQLRRGRLVRSYKGIGGGYELALPADRINLLKVVHSTGGEGIFEICVLEDRDCSPTHYCALHEYWAAIRDQLRERMENYTLADLVRACDLRASKVSKKNADLIGPADQ